MPGDIFCCSFPHLIALPCQTRAERAKAPSPVPRSISWQSFESNCDCSDLRASESNCVPTSQNLPCLAQHSSVLLYLVGLASTCPAPAWPWLSLLSLSLRLLSPTSSRDFPLLSPQSGPPLARLQSPVSSFQSRVSSSLGQHAVPIPSFSSLTSTRPVTVRLHTSSTGCRRQS